MSRETDDTDRIELRTPAAKLRAVESLLKDGWSRQEVADGLGLSVRTVDRRIAELNRIRSHPRACLAS